MGRERSALNYESNKRVQSKNNSKQGKCVLKPCTHLMGWSFEAYKRFLTWTRLTYSILPPELSPCLAVRNFSNKQSTKFDPFAYPILFPLHTFHLFNAPHFPCVLHCFHYAVCMLFISSYAIFHTLHFSHLSSSSLFIVHNLYFSPLTQRSSSSSSSPSRYVQLNIHLQCALNQD